MRAFISLNDAKARKSTRCNKCKNSKVLNDNGLVDIDYVMDYYYRHILKNIKKRNKVSQLEFNITPEYLKSLYLQQNGLCKLSGIPLDLKVIKTDDLIMSLDRINSDIGYVEGNVQWVHKDVNMMKQSYPNEYFIEMCKKISEYQNGLHN